MSHPFDNYRFGPNVDVMDINTGAVTNPFLNSLFAVKPPSPEEVAAEQHEARIARAKTAAIVAKTELQKYFETVSFDHGFTALKQVDRVNIAALPLAKDYLLRRSADARQLVADMAKPGGLPYGMVLIHPECKVCFKTAREEVMYDHMLLLLADVLARYW